MLGAGGPQGRGGGSEGDEHCIVAYLIVVNISLNWGKLSSRAGCESRLLLLQCFQLLLQDLHT